MNKHKASISKNSTGLWEVACWNVLLDHTVAFDSIQDALDHAQVWLQCGE